MNKWLLYITVILSFLLSDCTRINNKENKQIEGKPKIDLSHYRSLSKEAKSYCKRKNLNTEFYFLIDLNRHSGLNRFFIWNFKRNNFDDAFLVSHGCGNSPWGKDLSKENAEISNLEGSHASSIGKYIIADRGYSNWGINIKYLLHGQDKTNNNALKRQIVFHSWEEVHDEEVFPNGTVEGWGCPAISNSAMQTVDNKLKNSTKKVLMWVIK